MFNFAGDIVLSNFYNIINNIKLFKIYGKLTASKGIGVVVMYMYVIGNNIIYDAHFV